jgi:Ca2+-binding RTX toxin-like protein
VFMRESSPLLMDGSNRGLRRIGLAVAAVSLLLLGAGSAHAAVLSSTAGTITYVADGGERNDVLVSSDLLLGVPVYTFKDADANPITIGGGLCNLINGVGTCRRDGVSRIIIDVRDGDDTAQVATAGGSQQTPPTIQTTLIGGDGVDTLIGGFGPDILKGNNGRDSLRGRQGTDVYKGGRGSDTLQTLDGERDTFISCGEGTRDLLRADKKDPKPKSCELGGRKPGKQF